MVVYLVAYSVVQNDCAKMNCDVISSCRSLYSSRCYAHEVHLYAYAFIKATTHCTVL